MSIAEFLAEHEDYELSVEEYNAVFMWLHKNDAHVRVWKDGEKCIGCEE